MSDRYRLSRLLSSSTFFILVFSPVYLLHLCPPATTRTCAEGSPRRRILNVSRSVWKQANVASDLWEKLTARCVDRHRSDSCPPPFNKSKFNTSVVMCLLTLYSAVSVGLKQPAVRLRGSGITEIQLGNGKGNTDAQKN